MLNVFFVDDDFVDVALLGDDDEEGDITYRR
jgi:translation initiation factor IF-1